jgi:hypothetical protein
VQFFFVLKQSLIDLGCILACLWHVCLQERNLVEVTKLAELLLELLVVQIEIVDAHID